MKFLIAAFILAIALPTAARERVPVSWSCDMNGRSGLLVAEYEAVDQTGANVSPPRNEINSVIEAGKAIIFFTGTLTLDDESYVFSGEDHIAEFTNLGTLDRFLVHVMREGDTLRLTHDPLGTSSPVYTCSLIS